MALQRCNTFHQRCLESVARQTYATDADMRLNALTSCTAFLRAHSMRQLQICRPYGWIACGRKCQLFPASALKKCELRREVLQRSHSYVSYAFGGSMTSSEWCTSAYIEKKQSSRPRKRALMGGAPFQHHAAEWRSNVAPHPSICPSVSAR